MQLSKNLFYNKGLVKLVGRQIRNSVSTSKNASILGIETSCDDTGCAIVNENGNILGECLKSQGSIHTEFGGIIPPMANLLHKENIEGVVKTSLEKAGLEMSQIDAIATTVKPGLMLSLIVGMQHGKELAKKYKKPFIPIHHMEAHALTIRMIEKIDFPFMVLLISGGHCLISIAKDVDKFLLLGESLDDAPGEALDKIARRLKLSNKEEFQGMCGGQAIEVAALQGDPTKFHISEPLLQYRDCNFSFAGIKNSFRNCIHMEEEKYGIEADAVVPSVYDICASVQFGVIKHLCRRLQRAMEFATSNDLLPPSKQKLVVSGGVASNKTIGRALNVLCKNNSFELHVPPPSLCTDNGVMIAWNGVERYLAEKGIYNYNEIEDIDAIAKCPLGENYIEVIKLANLKSSRIPLKELQDSLKAT